jgi:hypothetical protein
MKPLLASSFGLSADWVSAYAAIIAVVLAVVGGLIAAREYRSGQEWKRLEFAASLLGRLTTDPKLETCCILLDWAPRRIAVPEAYRCFLPPNHPGYFVHTMDALREALNKRPADCEAASEEAKGNPAEGPLRFSWQEVFYRDYFDRFFDFLNEAYDCVRMKLLKAGDLKRLTYWLNKISKEKSTFDAFILDYHYAIGVKGLCHEFSKLRDESGKHKTVI